MVGITEHQHDERKAVCLGQIQQIIHAFHVAAINGGRHVAPTFAGDTIYAWSEVLETAEIPGRLDAGALRVRLVAAKDRACADFPLRLDGGEFDPAVVLELDYWVILPI